MELRNLLLEIPFRLSYWYYIDQYKDIEMFGMTDRDYHRQYNICLTSYMLFSWVFDSVIGITLISAKILKCLAWPIVTITVNKIYVWRVICYFHVIESQSAGSKMHCIVGRDISWTPNCGWCKHVITERKQKEWNRELKRKDIWIVIYYIHDDVIKWRHFQFTGHRWIPLTKISDAELWCFFQV